MLRSAPWADVFHLRGSKELFITGFGYRTTAAEAVAGIDLSGKQTIR